MKYPERVTDYFFNPKHAGILTGEGVLRAKIGDPILGDVIQLHLRHIENTVKTARFKALGDPYTIAAMEWLCCECEGLSLEKLIQLDLSALELPTHKHYLYVLLGNCLHLITEVPHHDV
jgi:nitrogen fixation protein NifU and related proteins